MLKHSTNSNRYRSNADSQSSGVQTAARDSGRSKNKSDTVHGVQKTHLHQLIERWGSWNIDIVSNESLSTWANIFFKTWSWHRLSRFTNFRLLDSRTVSGFFSDHALCQAILGSCTLRIASSGVRFLCWTNTKTQASPQIPVINWSTRSLMDSTSIASLNAQAVDMLRRGDYRQANSLLAKALHGVVAKISGPDHDNFNESESLLDSDRSPDALSSVRLDDRIHNLEDNNVLLFYNHAFVVRGDDDQILVSNERESWISAVLLYNMAMSYHLMATTTSSQQCRFYNTALKLYASAWCLLTSEFPIQSKDKMLLTMALLNNKAHLHACFHDGGKAYICLEWLQCSLENCHESVWEVEDGIVFQSNVFFFKHALEGHAASA